MNQLVVSQAQDPAWPPPQQAELFCPDHTLTVATEVDSKACCNQAAASQLCLTRRKALTYAKMQAPQKCLHFRAKELYRL